MVELSYQTPDKIKYMQGEIQKHKERMPVLSVIELPVSPLRADYRQYGQADEVQGMADRMELPGTEVKALLFEGLHSEDPVVVKALKQFLMVVKMRLPEDSELIADIRERDEYYQTVVDETNRKNKKFQESFDAEMKEWNLRLLKFDQVFTFFLDDLFTSALSRKTVLDQLFIRSVEALNHPKDNDPAQRIWNNITTGEKAQLVGNLAKVHQVWLWDQYDELHTQFYREFDKKIPYELDGEYFISAYDDDIDDDDPDLMNAYELAMSKRDDEVRWHANQAARDVMLKRVNDRIDGYDGPTYGYV